MTRDQDPALSALFAKAARINKEEAFIEQVMAQVDRSQRKSRLGWLVVGLLFVAAAWWISSPIIHATDFLLNMLPISLVDIDNRILAELLAPLNSIAGALALLFLVLRFAYRKLFR